MTVKLKSVVSKQIPEFVRSDYPLFVKFIEAYYEFLDESEQRNIESIRDIDLTDVQYLQSFKNELDIFGGAYSSTITVGEMKKGILYKIASLASNTDFTQYGASKNEVGHRFVATGPGAGAGTVYSSNIDYRLILRKVKDIFLAKGTEAAYKLLFKLLYNKTAEISYPWDLVLRASDGKWQQENSIFVSFAVGDATKLPGNTISFFGADKTINVFVTKVKPYDDGTGILTPAGGFNVGQTYIINTLSPLGASDSDKTDFTLIGASSNKVGTRFTATGKGSGLGTAVRDMTYEIFIDKNYYGDIQTDYQLRFNNVVAGNFQIGKTYTIVQPGSTDFTKVGSLNNAIGTNFTATGIGTGTGYVAEISGEILPTVTSFDIVQAGSNYKLGQIFDAATISSGRTITQKLKVTALTDKAPVTVRDGYLTIGSGYTITNINDSDFTLCGAISNEVGKTFVATNKGDVTKNGLVKTVEVATGGIKNLSVVQFAAGYTTDFYLLKSNELIAASANFTIDKDGVRQYSIPVDSKIEKYIDYGYVINPEYFDTSFSSDDVTAGNFQYTTLADPTVYIYQIKSLGDTDWVAVGAGGDAVASISSLTLDVSAIINGNIRIGCEINGPGIIPGTRVISYITGSGGVGTYKLEIPENSITFDATYNIDTMASDIDLTTDTLNYVSHGFITGQPVIYNNNSGTNIGGLSGGNVYYIIRVDDDNIQLASTEAFALAGTQIDLTSLPPFDPSSTLTNPNIIQSLTYVSDLFTLGSSTLSIDATVDTLFVCTGSGSGTGVAYRPKYTDDTYGGTLLRQFYQETTSTGEGVDPDYLLVRFKVGAVARYKGQYATNDGFLDDVIRLQDSDKWQKYSYIITVDEKFEKYKSLIKSYLHPAGVKVFGEYEIQNVNDLALGYDQTIAIGTVTSSLTSKVLVGVGTTFKKFGPGVKIYIDDDYLGTIKSVPTDTEIILETKAKLAVTNSLFVTSTKSRIALGEWSSEATLKLINKSVTPETSYVIDKGGIIRLEPYANDYYLVLPPYEFDGALDVDEVDDTIYLYRHQLQTGDNIRYLNNGNTNIGGLKQAFDAGDFIVGGGYRINEVGNTDWVAIGGTAQAVVTASISGYQMTVTGVTSGTLVAGGYISVAGITIPTYIRSQASGTPGGAGVYNLSRSWSIASTTITGQPLAGTTFYATGAGSGTGTATGAYWIIKVDANHIKLATTRPNALAGTGISLTGTLSGTTHILSPRIYNNGTGSETFYGEGGNVLSQTISLSDTVGIQLTKDSGDTYDYSTYDAWMRFNAATAVDNVAETITITGHGLTTGKAVLYTNGSGTTVGGLTNDSVYYIIKVDADTVKLAASAINATAGTAINLTAGVGTEHKLLYNY